MIRLLTILATVSPMLAAEVVAPVSAPPSVGFSVIRVIGALCLVLSLLFAGVWAYRNSARFGGGRARAAKLKVIETRSLGHRHSIFVVGYEQQRLLLSTSPTGVTMLTHLPEAAEAETEAEPAAASAPALPSFSTAFLQALTAVRK